MPEVPVGIDLGTTNSCAFYCLGGKFECVEYPGGRKLFPSFVRYSKNGITSGNSAKLYFGRSKNVVRNAKRLIGRYYNSQEVQNALNYCGVPVVDRGNKPFFYIRETNTYYSPSDVGAEILKEIKKAIESNSDCTIGDVVVTIPANFDHNQRQATREAISKAGFNMNRVKLLNEPSAAAICYGLVQDAGNKKILVYDFDERKLDVSILDISNGNYKVLVHDGDNFLGGSNIDEIILNWLIERFDETYGEELIPANLDPEMKTQTRSGLLSLCEQAKEQLFDMDEYEIEPQIYMDEGYSVTITRDILNDLIDEELDKTMEIVERALNKAGLSKRDISRVVLVGGSTRLLLVQKKLADYFGKEKTTQSVNPDECVAQGACMALVNNVLPKEKTAFSLNMLITNNEAVCIIPSNSVIPCSKSIVITTAEDYAETLFNQICLGKCTNEEEVVPLAECILLPSFQYGGFPRKPRGQVHFEITFCYTMEGHINVSVLCQETGAELLNTDFTWDPSQIR